MFHEDRVSQALVHEYSCVTTTNCEKGFVSETKSHARVREKSTLSGGGFGSQPAKMVATSGGNDAKKAGFKQQYFWNAVYLSNISWALCLSTDSGSEKKSPCEMAVNWGPEVINFMSLSVNFMSLSVKKTEKEGSKAASFSVTL